MLQGGAMHRAKETPSPFPAILWITVESHQVTHVLGLDRKIPQTRRRPQDSP